MCNFNSGDMRNTCDGDMRNNFARVQLHGCGALANLCVVNENRSRVVKMGGIKSIIEAIKVIVPKP